MQQRELVIVRGGGDIASGAIQKLQRSGFLVLCLEVAWPTAIRRSVALCQAAYDGQATVEEMHCIRVQDEAGIAECHAAGAIPLLIDPEGQSIAALRPLAVVDAILAKHNLGTHRAMAPITVGLGPGFCAGQDVDAVVETMRGHDLGRVFYRGSALPNTGQSGEVGGQTGKRVIHAPVAGTVRPIKQIGDVVHEGEAILLVDQHFVKAPLTGLLRGVIRPGLPVPKGLKIADIDPRTDIDVHTISDKARCVGGGVLEALLHLKNKRETQRGDGHG